VADVFQHPRNLKSYGLIDISYNKTVGKFTIWACYLITSATNGTYRMTYDSDLRRTTNLELSLIPVSRVIERFQKFKHMLLIVSSNRNILLAYEHPVHLCSFNLVNGNDIRSVNPDE